jgi:glutaredoxin-like protein NrdH
MADTRGSIPGSHNEHHVAFYGLSTCIWCKRTRQFLESEKVKFEYVYVDLLHGQEREEAIKRIKQWNPAVSFPTVVVDDAQCVVGFKPDKLKEILEL